MNEKTYKKRENTHNGGFSLPPGGIEDSELYWIFAHRPRAKIFILPYPPGPGGSQIFLQGWGGRLVSVPCEKQIK